MDLRINVERINKDLPMPSYAYRQDAAVDLFSSVDIIFEPGEFKAVPTGLKMEIPDGYVGLIWDKSGIAIKNGIKTLGGVVDAGYRGEVMVGIINLSKKTYHFEKGSKIAQMIFQKKENLIFDEVEKIGESERGERGFGSSGK